MSLHSQLLRGLLALPVMLLLAVAGVIAPEATPSPLPESGPVVEVPGMVDSAPHAPCPHRMVRVQLVAR